MGNANGRLFPRQTHGQDAPNLTGELELDADLVREIVAACNQHGMARLRLACWDKRGARGPFISISGRMDQKQGMSDFQRQRQQRGDYGQQNSGYGQRNGYERQGSGYDPGAAGHERQGRDSYRGTGYQPPQGSQYRRGESPHGDPNDEHPQPRRQREFDDNPDFNQPRDSGRPIDRDPPFQPFEKKPPWSE